MSGFILWMIFSAAFVVYGIYAFFSKRTTPFGFWANAKVFEVNDVKGYNRAVGILFGAMGFGFALFGIPLLGGQNSPYAMISVLGAMAEAIAASAVYVTVIEKKYRKRG